MTTSTLVYEQVAESGINRSLSPISEAVGGFKQSGIGREQAADGIELYTETKSVLMRI